jgi:pyridoxine kinase
MNILSIQSHVVCGHVGNSAAVFPLQRIGIEVWPVHTVQFSSHTGYGPAQGGVFDADLIRRVIKGIAGRGILGECDGILSGYLGSAETGAAVLEAVDQVKTVAPLARYCCDPVIGDAGRGVFVQPGIPEFIKERAVPAADLVTPNQFELDYLSGRATRNRADMHAALDTVHAMGPTTILITSLHSDETPAGCIDLIASDEDGRWLLRIPELPVSLPGAGDMIAALFLAHSLQVGSTADALSCAASSVFGVLRRSVEQGSHEMLVIESQDEFVEPSETFTPRRM